MSWVQAKFSDYVSRPTKKQKTERANSKTKTRQLQENAEEREWLNKWKPKKKSDLVVHKKKIEEVEKWLEVMKQKSNAGSILLLYGPNGCGKLATLKVLGNEAGINLIEWIPPVALSKYDPDSVLNVPYQSEISIFEDFIMRATRYSNVLNRNSCRLIVVKDVPLQFIQVPSKFHNFLTKFSSINNVNLVFILTDFKISRDLFSDDVKHQFGITSIQFNPITQRNILTALQKIANGKYTKCLDSISSSCDGDLRNAITTLHFVAVNGVLPPRKEREQSIDEAHDIFHAIGRVLYAKREENGQLKHCPFSVAESVLSTPDLFVSMLHENYLGIYSSIHEVAKASKCLVESDFLLKPMDSSNTSSLSLSIAANGLMMYNSKPVKKFQQFNKPKRIVNNLAEFRVLNKNTESLIDIVAYGKKIPAFSSLHQEIYEKVVPLKSVP